MRSMNPWIVHRNVLLQPCFHSLCPSFLSAPLLSHLLQSLFSLSNTLPKGGPSCLSWVQNPFPSLYLQVRQNMSGRCFQSLVGDAPLFSLHPRHQYLFLGWFSQLSSLLHSGTPGSETRLHPSVFCSGLILFGSQFIDIPPRALGPNTHFYKWDYFLVTKTNTIYILKWFWHFGNLHGQVLHWAASKKECSWQIWSLALFTSPTQALVGV